MYRKVCGILFYRESDFLKTCSFFGHRNTEATPELLVELRKTILYLIEEKDVKRFLFGNASRFDDLCLKMVTQIQESYPQIQRIYVRSQYPYIEKLYKEYLLESYDDTTMPSKVEKAGKASYVERNQEMINASDICVFYYNAEYEPPLRKQSKNAISMYQPKSGTKLAYEYVKKEKRNYQFI